MLGYEQSIREGAERNGWTAVREVEYIRVSDGTRSVRHRLHGLSERAYNDRAMQSRCRGDKP
jgi:hypothetical protein